MKITDSSPFFSKADTLNADTKTGGTYMYIHSYQIHNVLNDYRKQLSHGPRSNGGKQPTVNETRDRISISKDGQRQSIMTRYHLISSPVSPMPDRTINLRRPWRRGSPTNPPGGAQKQPVNRLNSDIPSLTRIIRNRPIR